jgi:ribosome-associated protein
MCSVGVEISSRSAEVGKIQEVPISGRTIRLGQLLKLSGIAESGGDSKALLFGEVVRVNGVQESRRGRQLRAGDLVEARGESVRVIAG